MADPTRDKRWAQGNCGRPVGVWACTPYARKFIAGPNKRILKSRSGLGPLTSRPAETTGRSDQDPGPSASPSTSTGPVQDPNPPGCECAICGRRFSSASGRGLHVRRAHPVEANAAIVVASKKRRWSEEELSLMAREEAIATLAGVAFMNQHLVAKLGGRSQEAIKGARRSRAYKDKVIAILSDMRTAVATPAHEATPPVQHQPDVSSPAPSPTSLLRQEEDAARQSLISAVRSLSGLIREADGRSRQSSLIVSAADAALTGQDAGAATLEWLHFITASQPPSSRTASRPPTSRPAKKRTSPGSTKARRRREYARVQSLWVHNRKRAAQEVMEGPQPSAQHSLAEMTPYWSKLFGQPSLHVGGPAKPHTPGVLTSLWDPVTCEEAEKISIPLSSAPGLDGISPRLWQKIPSIQKALAFNIWMLLGGLPDELTRTRTVFIPKLAVPKCPSHYRPISVSSVAVRHFHKILAHRLTSFDLFDDRQRAFLPCDGACENIAVLDALLSTSRTQLRELHVATLDMQKAFDTVSHHALTAVCLEKGLPIAFTDYVRSVYSSASTILEVGGAKSDPVRVSRGVRQGDPLSPALFNLVVDLVLQAIPEEVGFKISGKNISALAFADDLVLVASSRWGLQDSIYQVEEAAAKTGLGFNVDKSSTLSLVPAGKSKKIKVDTEHPFRTTSGLRLPATGVVGRWKYLGIEFEAAGSQSLAQTLASTLANITRAPLKPQQRLEILRNFLIPRIYYALVLGKTTAGHLGQLDRETRLAVRQWLRLPPDVPAGFFHAAIRDGGLGVPSLTTLIPSLVVCRFSRLQHSSSAAARAAWESAAIQRKLRWARKALRSLGIPSAAPTASDRQKYWRDLLYASVDGKELSECPNSSLSTSWIYSPAHFIPGRDFVQHVHARINCLPTRIRVSRGTSRSLRDTGCRAGCQATETAAHVIQCCPRTHGGRVKRHDAVVSTICRELADLGYRVVQEPRIQTSAGLRKPDIIASKEDRGVLIDAQIVSGASSLHRSHEIKRAKYAGDPEVCTRIAEILHLPPASITHTTCTVSWRGVWAARSHKDLEALGLRHRALAGITTRVLQGSHTNWSRFNSSTSMFGAAPTWTTTGSSAATRTGIG